MKKKQIILGIFICLILIFNIEIVSTKSNYDPKLSIEIITEKEIFPRFIKDSSIFNATIIVTNKGLEDFEDFVIIVVMCQLFPGPRVPNEHEIGKPISLLEPGKSIEVNYS